MVMGALCEGCHRRTTDDLLQEQQSHQPALHLARRLYQKGNVRQSRGQYAPRRWHFAATARYEKERHQVASLYRCHHGITHRVEYMTRSISVPTQNCVIITARMALSGIPQKTHERQDMTFIIAVRNARWTLRSRLERHEPPSIFSERQRSPDPFPRARVKPEIIDENACKMRDHLQPELDEGG